MFFVVGSGRTVGSNLVVRVCVDFYSVVRDRFFNRSVYYEVRGRVVLMIGVN